MQETSIAVTFWGVRGTVPTPDARNMRYGGNTSCVEARCGKHVFVFDAGSGVYPMGERLGTKNFDILLSHTHIDHILGLPFLSQMYDKDCAIRIWAGHLAPEGSIRDALSRVIAPPIFPLTLADMKASLSFHDFRAGEELMSDPWSSAGVRIRTLPLSHPDRATAYRLDYGGHSVCYVTDVEHRSGALDHDLVEFIDGADLFIYDSTFDDAQFEKYKGWGHSTWQHAVRLGDAANVEAVALFHHDPAASDAVLDARARTLQATRPGSFVAREGMTVTLPLAQAQAATMR